MVLGGCNEPSDKLDPTIVNNPKSASGEDKGGIAILKFDTVLQSFGTITQGEEAEMMFSFTNAGDAPLIISSARGSCGCTVPEWPKDPVSPGQSGNIKVVFSSEGKKGTQHKKVYIVANTDPSTNVVAIKGEVIAPTTTK